MAPTIKREAATYPEPFGVPPIPRSDYGTGGLSDTTFFVWNKEVIGLPVRPRTMCEGRSYRAWAGVEY